jgi:hypothetical protein
MRTDRPYLIDLTSGLTVPDKGFGDVCSGYSIGDALHEDESSAAAATSSDSPYPITPEEFLKLKSCFDRINRPSCKKRDLALSTEAKAKREYWRMRFNASYLKLKQLVIGTRYRYNMRRYIVTPPITQCTHHYDALLRRLCRLDMMSPKDLQAKKAYVQRDRQQQIRWQQQQRRRQQQQRRLRTIGSGGDDDDDDDDNNNNDDEGKKRALSLPPPTPSSSSSSSCVTNNVLQRLWKSMNEAELVNKSIKDQTQGGKSFLKQFVIPGKMLNCLYGKVLPDPTLRPDEIGLPGHVMESVFKGVNMNRIAAIVKRDPVFSIDAITTFTRVKTTDYPYITLPSEIITNKQLDFDGDNVSVVLVNSGRCFIETLMRLSPKVQMYCQFYRTRLSFSQTNPFRVAGLLKSLRSSLREVEIGVRGGGGGGENTEHYDAAVRDAFGDTFAYCHSRMFSRSPDRASVQLNETLVSLSQQYGARVPYGFVTRVRELSFGGGFNDRRIYPVGPDAHEQAFHVAASGSKGTPDGVKNMFETTTEEDTIQAETLEYAKLFIEVKSLIRKQGHNAKKMDSAFQNVIVNHDDHLTMRVNNVIYDLGHVINYLQREWIMSDLTIQCLLNNVNEGIDKKMNKN